MKIKPRQIATVLAFVIGAMAIFAGGQVLLPGLLCHRLAASLQFHGRPHLGICDRHSHLEAEPLRSSGGGSDSRLALHSDAHHSHRLWRCGSKR